MILFHVASNVLVIVSFPLCVFGWILCEAKILNVDPAINVPQKRDSVTT